jgi:radical SAM protein with 4Fe4S-binding SPASM domain
MSLSDLKINKDGAKTIQEFLDAKHPLQETEDFIKAILGAKAPYYTEIDISFFELCNLHCRFCWQDNYNPTGITDIAEKANIAIDYLKAQKDKLQPNIQVHMLGGELFQDDVDYYDQYFKFVCAIKDYCDEHLPEKNLTFVFLTNMNFQKPETGIYLDIFIEQMKLENIKFILTTSWDPTGRPLKGDIETQFHKNITKYKQYMAEVTFVLTKPTINRLLQGHTAYLDLLYANGFMLDYDYYMPTKEVDSMMPSDRDLLEVITMLKERFPKINKVKAWTEEIDTPGKLTCASLNKITILPDGTLTNCRHLNYDQSDFDSKITNEANADMIMNYITKRECLSCEYFYQCPMSCFVMSDHKKFLEQKELDECFYKILFRENTTT